MHSIAGTFKRCWKPSNLLLRWIRIIFKSIFLVGDHSLRKMLYKFLTLFFVLLKHQNRLNHRPPSLLLNKAGKSEENLISWVVHDDITGSQCNLCFFGGGQSASVEGIRDTTTVRETHSLVKCFHSNPSNILNLLQDSLYPGSQKRMIF